MRKDEIETRGQGYDRDGIYRGLPCLNVKVWYKDRDVDWADIAGEFDWDADELDRFRVWLEDRHDHAPESVSWAWDAACEEGWELASADAELVWENTSYRPALHSEGRCGGWLVVNDLPDVETWDAVMVAKWTKFAKWVEAIRADTSYRYVWLIAANVWEIEKTWSSAETADAVL